MSLILNIDDIKALHISDVVGRYVALKKAGTRLVACCPFHNERSPSFGVSDVRGIYKCFGCGESGDGVDFVMKHENLTFLEAVERIAAEHNIRLEKDKSVDYDAEKARIDAERKEKETLHLVQEWAARAYFEKNYGTDGNYGTVSMDGRKLHWETVQAFGLCYTSDDSNFLRVESAKQGWGMEVLLQTGLLREGRDGSGSYDGFYRRHLFPIRDHRGKMAGFGARLLKADEEKPDNKRPKYINSPEHPMYKKSELLYGLWQNKKDIAADHTDHAKNRGFAYIVEGYMDVVTMYDHGIQNAVAPCGTALTDDQIDLLAKYTDEVVLCFDADAAGQAATERSVERLLQKGFRVNVLQMPSKTMKVKHDPDSFLRQVGLTKPILETARWKQEVAPGVVSDNLFKVETGDAGWAGLMRNKLVNAVEWMVLRDYKPDDPHDKAEKIELAARLLAYIESDVLRNQYTDSLSTKAKLGSVKRDLKDAIASRRDEIVARPRYKFTHAQQQDRLKYGIYIQSSKFWQAIGDGEGYELTNFIVEPLMCVIGNNRSLRLVRITNEDGYSSSIEMDSDDIVELSTFKKVVARKGNFVFKATCKAEHFARIQAKIMAETPNVYPIYTMGMHEMPDSPDFYAFSNGIFTKQGFHPIDDFGSVKIEKVTYYLPAFAKVRSSLGEQVSESFEDIKPYFYPLKGEEVSLKDWTGRIKSVYGANGMVGAAWAMAAIHRDIIFRRFKMFPHLNLFGVPQSGKNQLAGSLTALFGMPQPPIGLENATKAAMTRLISVIRNGVVWFDEYKNDVDRWIVELLKGFADGTSRRKGDANMENRTISTPVNSAAIISGQHQLTLDIAMFSRTISLNFDKTTYTDDARNALRELKDIEETGILTHLTAKMHGYRSLFAEKFNTEFEFVRTDFSSGFPAGSVVSDRVLNMFCVPLTALRILGAQIECAFGYDELKGALLDIIMTQKDAMFAENEVSIWWRIIEYLLERRELQHGQDIICEYQKVEYYDLDWHGKNKVKKEYWNSNGEGQKKLLYIYFGVSHPLYMRQHYDERKIKGLDKQALFLYLRTSDAFEGIKQGKKFGGKSKSCMVFDADKLPFDIPLTIEVMTTQSRAESKEPEKQQELVQDPVADDTPF